MQKKIIWDWSEVIDSILSAYIAFNVLNIIWDYGYLVSMRQVDYECKLEFIILKK